MDIAYWVVAALLALFYLYAGGLKLVRSQAQLAPTMAWAGTAIPMAGVRAIGAVEVLGAAGLVLPPLTGVAPWLATAAAIGFVVLQSAALGFHASRRENRSIGMNLGLLMVAATLVWLATAVV